MKHSIVSGLMASAKLPALYCIDLSDPDIHHSVSLLKQACSDSGFFYLVNHGISQELMDEVFAQSKKFFDLPMEEKMKLLRNEKHRGYTPILDQLLDPKNQVNGDYKECYFIGIDVPENDPEAHKPFNGQNIWANPDVLIGWRETMEKYHEEALEVGRSLARIIALALDLDIHFFDKPQLLGKPMATLRLLHYEGRVSDPTKGIFGAGAHSDFGFITLLATDHVIGLQICKNKDATPQIWEYVPPLKGAFIVNLGDMLERWSNSIFRVSDPTKGIFGAGAHSDFGFITLLATDHVIGLQICKDKDAKPQRWENVPPLRGAFIVNIGDMLERWSNSLFRSTLHRVLCNGQERYSIASFLEPSQECLVECLPTCHSEKNPPKFPPIKCEDYLLQRFKDIRIELDS